MQTVQCKWRKASGLGLGGLGLGLGSGIGLGFAICTVPLTLHCAEYRKPHPRASAVLSNSQPWTNDRATKIRVSFPTHFCCSQYSSCYPSSCHFLCSFQCNYGRPPATAGHWPFCFTAVIYFFILFSSRNLRGTLVSYLLSLLHTCTVDTVVHLFSTSAHYHLLLLESFTWTLPADGHHGGCLKDKTSTTKSN